MARLSPQPRMAGQIYEHKIRVKRASTSTTSSFVPTDTSTGSPTSTVSSISPLSTTDDTSSSAEPSPTTQPSTFSLSTGSSVPTSNTGTSTLPSSVSPSLTGSSPSFTTSSISNNTAVPDNSGVSPGAVAGIAVGTFIAGAALALVFFCVFAMLKKKKHRSRGSRGQERLYRDSEYSQENSTPMKQMASSVSPVGAGIDGNLNRVLLEPVSTSEIKTDMLAIGSQILQHVDNNYHIKPVDALPPTFTQSLTQAGYSAFSDISIEQLDKLLRNVQTRRAAIRHLISFFIFSKILSTSDVETSLLPHHIISFLKKMPAPERTSGSQEAFDMTFSKWRRLSAYLLQSVRSNRDPLLPDDNDVQPAITRNINTLRQILAVFVIAGAERRQAENLQGLMAEGAKFGLILFQQPELWVLDWEGPYTGSTDPKTKGNTAANAATIILFPGLTKVLDEEGKRYTKTKIVLAAEVL